MENVRERRYEVDSNFDGWRLDRFLANRIGRLSRTRAGEIAKYGDISIDPPRKVKAGTRLRLGDVVILREHLPPETVQYDEVSILYRDEAVVALSKPAGMLVHEAASVRLNTVQMYLQKHGWPDGEPAHRIDRETSGVLLCAATSAWVTPLREMFATAHPTKVYRALAVDPEGRWRPGDERTIEIPLRLASETRLGLRMVRGDLRAVTHVSARERHGDLVDLEVRIETGRQHQIRVHLAMEGTPIAGDKLYTYDDAFFMAITDHPDDEELRSRLPFERHMLHAWRLAFPHPETGEEVSVEAPLPKGWGGVRSAARRRHEADAD